MQSVHEALATVTREVHPLVAKRLGLALATGAVLAQPIVMDADSPAFDRAVLDGFALRSADALAGAALRIIGRQDAGGPLFEGVVASGECLGINTGGRMPAGTDAVLMVEHAQVSADTVKVGKGVPPGYGVQGRGADAHAGQVVLTAGVRLGAAQIAVAATAGAAKLSVRHARVAILTTGDELVPIDTTPGPGQIRNSNGPMLAALVRETGAEVVDLGTVVDRPAELRAALQRGLAEADLLLVSGGMSMGTRDLVPPMLKDLGVEIHIEKVRMKPGKPFLFGTFDTAVDAGGGTAAVRKYVAGLPGNPVSAFVTFQRLVREVLALMVGESGGLRVVEARAAEPLEPNGDREFYQPCSVDFEGGAIIVRPLSWKGSADLFTLARAKGLLVRAAAAGAIAAGEPVSVILL